MLDIFTVRTKWCKDFVSMHIKTQIIQRGSGGVLRERVRSWITVSQHVPLVGLERELLSALWSIINSQSKSPIKLIDIHLVVYSQPQSSDQSNWKEKSHFYWINDRIKKGAIYNGDYRWVFLKVLSFICDNNTMSKPGNSTTLTLSILKLTQKAPEPQT